MGGYAFWQKVSWEVTSYKFSQTTQEMQTKTNRK